MPQRAEGPIRVVVDDLAFVTADAVVRPADERLDPVSTAATWLDRHAGSRFAAQRQVASLLPVGAAVVTGSGDLAAPFVLHVVIQGAEQSASPETVRRALVSAWQRAAEWRLATVAAPLIGTGVGQHSLEDAAMLLAETFPVAGGADACPAELQIVVDREEERTLVEAVLRGRRP